MMTPWVLLKTSKKSAAMKCLITNKEYNLVDLDRLEGRAEVAASQETMKPFLFNLKKIADYHPLLGTSDIVSDKTEGVGAKRKLTYADGSGTSFFETVVRQMVLTLFASRLPSILSHVRFYMLI